MKDYDSPEERTKTMIHEIAMHLYVGAVTEPLYIPEAFSLIEDGVRSYFETHEEEWIPFQEWADGVVDDEAMSELFTAEVLFPIYKYCQEEMAYEWLTSERQFAYDYTW